MNIVDTCQYNKLKTLVALFKTYFCIWWLLFSKLNYPCARENIWTDIENLYIYFLLYLEADMAQVLASGVLHPKAQMTNTDKIAVQSSMYH